MRLTASFYRRHTEIVAKELIGCILRTPDADVRILETEAYLHENDPACHASRGITPRNRVMFESGGVVYVYFIYGMHWCTNVVTDKRGRGAAVLLRAGIVLRVWPKITENLPIQEGQRINGPGRLSKAIGFDQRMNGRSLLRGSEISIFEDEKTRDARNDIIATPRIGISQGTDLLLRFVCNRSEFF